MKHGTYIHTYKHTYGSGENVMVRWPMTTTQPKWYKEIDCDGMDVF